MANDMVFDNHMNPAWCNTPEKTRAWLRYRLKDCPEMWTYQVRIGKTMKFVAIQQYLCESEPEKEPKKEKEPQSKRDRADQLKLLRDYRRDRYPMKR